MTYRVIQWATGVTGGENIRLILATPGVELVGVYVTNPDKHGVDAGTLVGCEEAGVKATANREEILGLEADCVLHNASVEPGSRSADDDVCALLASGKNVVSIVPGFLWPAATGLDRAERIEAAGLAGGATLLGTGLDPGFMDRLGHSLVGLTCSLRSVSFTASYDVSERARPHHVFDVMGIGRPPEEFDVGSPRGDYYFRIFDETIRLLAHRLGSEVEALERRVRVGLASEDLSIAAGTVAKGTVAAVEWGLDARLMDGSTARYRAQRIARRTPGWESPFGWTLEVDGDPSARLTASIRRGSDPQTGTEPEHRANSATQVRAVAEAVAAPSGITVPGVFLGGPAPLPL